MFLPKTILLKNVCSKMKPECWDRVPLRHIKVQVSCAKYKNKYNIIKNLAIQVILFLILS